MMQRFKYFKNFKRQAISLSVFVALTAASGLPQDNQQIHILTPSGFALNSAAQFSQALGLASEAHAQSSNSGQDTQLTSAQLQSLVSSIALYPDSLLSMMLMASTYPLEVAEAYNWLEANKTLSRTQIQDAMKTQTWDNSIKSLVLFPQALTLMGTKLGWTQQLGNAYLAQPKQLMDAVQALRTKAQQAGNLKSNDQVSVSTQQSNIIIAPANPQIIYVPQYNPTVVYGGWPYPAYPPAPVYNPGWGLVTFGVGLAVGAALWSSPHWNSGSININNNNFNNFNRNVNSNNTIKNNRIGDSSNWRPNASNRANVNQSQREATARANASRASSDWDKNATSQDRQRAQQDANRARSSAASRGFENNRSNDATRSNASRSDSGDRRAEDNRSFSGGDRRSSGGGRSFGGFGGGHFGGGFRR
jgi:uncharacterized membrane protein YgcG